MAANKKFNINNDEMTITADLAKLNSTEIALLNTYVALGYKFVAKQNRRNSVKRKREYFDTHLSNYDRKIFYALYEARGYASATSFGNTVIKLYEFVSQGICDDATLDEYRKDTLSDYGPAQISIKAKIKGFKKGAKELEIAAMCKEAMKKSSTIQIDETDTESSDTPDLALVDRSKVA